LGSRSQLAIQYSATKSEPFDIIPTYLDRRFPLYISPVGFDQERARPTLLKKEMIRRYLMNVGLIIHINCFRKDMYGM
jgi:hypothetical protein